MLAHDVPQGGKRRIEAGRRLACDDLLHADLIPLEKFER